MQDDNKQLENQVPKGWIVKENGETLFTYEFMKNHVKTVREEKAKKEKLYSLITILSTLFALAVFLYLDYFNFSHFGFVLICSGISTLLLSTSVGVFIQNSKPVDTTLTSDYYYMIDKSKDKHGNHRCIYCGGKGVHKRTIYKTDDVVAKCTKCQKTLFID